LERCFGRTEIEAITRPLVVDAEKQERKEKRKTLLSEKKEVCSKEFDRATLLSRWEAWKRRNRR
jgi:hypothetical protein